MTRSYITLYEETGTPAVTHINDWLNGTTGLQYGHDALGRITSITEYDVNKHLSYAYDAAGRISSMTDYFGHTTTYGWTARGDECITPGFGPAGPVVDALLTPEILIGVLDVCAYRNRINAQYDDLDLR